LSERMNQVDEFLDDLQNYHKTNKKIGKTLEDLLQTEEELSNTYANYGKHDARNNFFHEMVAKYGGHLTENLSEEKEDSRNFIGLLSSDDKEDLNEQRESYEKRISLMHDIVNLVVDTDDERIQELYEEQQDLTNDLTRLEEKKWKLQEETRQSFDNGAINVNDEHITIAGEVYRF
jgi:gas vesicle protein